MKGMLVNIYKTAALGDCTNGGVTAKANTALLVGEGVPEIFEESDRYPTLKLTTGYRGMLLAQPNFAAKGVGWMMGGNFIHTSDSRFPGNGAPIPVHDRTESQAEYDMLSR